MKTLPLLFKTSHLAVFASTACVLFSAVSPAPAATITPKSQARSVQIAVSFGGVPQSTSAKATGYGPFNKTLNYAGGAGFDTYQVQAVQTSQVDAAAISATGSIINRLGHPFASDANAQSDFKVTFRVTQTVTYTLGGSLLWDEIYPDPAAPSPTVTLSGASGVIYEANTMSDGTPVDYTTNGTLPPGDYVIEGHAAALLPYGGMAASKSFSLLLSVTPVGPPPPGPGQVYAFNGSLIGLQDIGGVFTPVTLKAADLVNLALAKPATNVPKNEVLALVSDNLDHSLRIVVWDIKAAAVLSELGQVVLSGGLVSPTDFATMADVPINHVGSLLDTLNNVPSMLTMIATGTFDPANPATANKLTANPCIGQLSYVDATGASQSVLIHRGSLVTGRKLGTTP
ncbi:MAG: hypothetical protein WCF18_18240 [Chthoniobacteraceae bacterium]